MQKQATYSLFSQSIKTLAQKTLTKTPTKVLAAVIAALLLGACSNDETQPSVDPSAMEKVGLVKGTHYEVLKTPAFEMGDKFIVHEFFWYGCPHCEVFEPALHHWKKTLLGGVTVKQVPAIWAEPMELHAKIFYLVERQPREQREALHAALFKKIIAIRGQRNLNVQKTELAALLAEHGIDQASFDAALSDETIAKQVEEGKALMKKSGATGTPSLMVNGRYRVLNDTAEYAEDVIEIADKIIHAERLRLKAEKAAGSNT